MDLTYELLSTGDLLRGEWQVIGTVVEDTTPLPDDGESVRLREADGTTSPARFYRLRVTLNEEDTQ